MRYTISAVFLMLIGVKSHAQTNNQTGSPYSLFGLGRFNDAAPGKTNAMGESGIALPMTSEINNLNPAAYATIPEKFFMFDLGGKGERNEYSNADSAEKATTFSFSNIAFAFALSKKDGIGMSLLPYSDVGYNITGVRGQIEGSDDIYNSDVSGSGGLSAFAINYGRKISSRFNVGLGVNYLFGKIEEDEFATVGSDLLVTQESSFYRGFRFTVGTQAKVSDNFTLASTLKLPASIKGTRDLTAFKVVDLIQTSLEVAVDEPIESFRLPAELTFGGYYKIGESLGITADYRRSFWSATGMEDNIGKFVEQDFFGFGFEFLRNKNNYRYLDKVRVRGGMNFDNGYLAVNDKRITNYKATVGLGLPIPGKLSSMVNLSYGIGSRGMVSETLVRENYRTFSFNIVLQDIWFTRNKYD
ncbi:hypothetical protein [Flavobacterium sp.]|uniref:hypothetical protein n=1 Tax=Flavobacterium sp. TaxID=239 RepID=UPI0012115BEC|nr:hypothetical protein [Flavobacterium sp.]RZJ72276.1 MAG: hypothetical protein EOO49_07435 [Flavobacterium sp.]